MPFHTQVINATARDATYVLDGLLHHQSDLRIEEHYTDTAGFTDHVFALCHLLGYRFTPRIRDLADKRLYAVGPASDYPMIEPLVAARINTGLIADHWGELLRLAVSISGPRPPPASCSASSAATRGRTGSPRRCASSAAGSGPRSSSTT